MSIYQNELAPWEKKNQYYQNLQLGNNINDQVNHLNKQTKEMIETQLGTANSIIASQERISEKTDAVVRGVSNVEQGILELKSAFEWGISEVVWQIEQNRIVLKEILEVLMAPLDTQAKERRTRAEEAYINGWIEDAEEEFLESEKINKFDFSIHISLGIIYLFHRIDKPKALQYFKKAIKYSKPKSAFHTSFSLLYKALICYDMGNIEKAEKNSFEALTLTPTLSEAYYQNAQYNAQLIETDKSISHLEIAIKSDKLYCLKANSDKMFDPIRENVNNLFEKLKNDEKEKAILALEKLTKQQNKIKSLIKDMRQEPTLTLSNVKNLEISYYSVEKKLTDLSIMMKRESYFDFLDINNNIIPDTYREQNELTEKIIDLVSWEYNRAKSKLEQAKKDHDKKNNIKNIFNDIDLPDIENICLVSSAVAAVVTLFVMEGAGKFYFIFFIIPFISQLFMLGLVGGMIFNYSSMNKYELILGWCIVLFWIGAIVYYLSVLFKYREKFANIIENESHKLKVLSPYNERISNLHKIDTTD